MAKKATDERSEEVKKITRSKAYKEIEKDLLDELEANGTCGKFFEDMVQDYMAMYVTKTLLVKDIQKRGTIVEYNNGGGQCGFKKNESVDMFNKTNALLNISDKQGFCDVHCHVILHHIFKIFAASSVRFQFVQQIFFDCFICF